MNKRATDKQGSMAKRRMAPIGRVEHNWIKAIVIELPVQTDTIRNDFILMKAKTNTLFQQIVLTKFNYHRV